LIALEIQITDQVKVFVNPAEYVFEDVDHYGYVIHHKLPDFDKINKIDLNVQSAENFFILEYLNKKEQINNKKE
jgi:potassium large conductance calcium-activated channel subfamily M alpha protein 1